MKRVSTFFYDKSSLTVALALTIITFSYLYLVMIEQAKCFEVAGNTTSLGTSLGFTLGLVQEFFYMRTAEMVACYKTFNTVWDNIFPVLYGLMHVTWLSFLFKPLASKFKLLNLFPFLQTTFDWLENFMLVDIASNVLAKEGIESADVALASFFSISKWISASLIFLLILVGIGIRVYRAIKN